MGPAAFLSEPTVRREMAAGLLVCPEVHPCGLTRDLSMVGAQEEPLPKAGRHPYTFIGPDRLP